VEEEGGEDGGDFDEREGGFEAVDFVDVQLVGVRGESGGVDGQVDDDVAAEGDAGEGMDAAEEEVEAAGGGAEGGEGGVSSLVMI